jgi:hypothetical protein
VRASYGLCANLRQTNIVKLSFLDHFIQHWSIVLDLVVRVAPCGFEQVELLRSAQRLEDRIDAPAQIFLTSVYRKLAGDCSALDGEEGAVGVLGVLFEEARD